MNTEKFGLDQRDAYEIFSLTPRLKAALIFRTETSISFRLLTDAADSSRADYNGVGWVDVHHPADEPIKTRIKMRLPKELESEVPPMIKALFESLEIPHDETYSALRLSESGDKIWLQPVDRDGRDWGDRWDFKWISQARFSGNGVRPEWH